MRLRNLLQINQYDLPPFCRPRSYSRERDDYYARRDHHREREREREGDRYRSERDRYYRERSRSPRTRDRERAEREKYYEVRCQNIVEHRLRESRPSTSGSQYVTEETEGNKASADSIA